MYLNINQINPNNIKIELTKTTAIGKNFFVDNSEIYDFLNYLKMHFRKSIIRHDDQSIEINVSFDEIYTFLKESKNRSIVDSIAEISNNMNTCVIDKNFKVSIHGTDGDIISVSNIDHIDDYNKMISIISKYNIPHRVLKMLSKIFITFILNTVQKPKKPSKYLNSEETLKLLNIDRFKLAYLRKIKAIKFKQISPKKIIYPLANILEFGIYDKNIDDVDVCETSIKVIGPEDKIKIHNQIDVPQIVIDFLKIHKNKVPPYKLAGQNYFLNFANKGVESSPQVMLNDELDLVDLVSNEILVDRNAITQYIDLLIKENINPVIELSKKVIPGFKKYYLNNI